MANQKRRQELYDKIRSSSKKEVILEEMKRLGFWERDAEFPALAEQDIKRKGELNKRLNSLLKRQGELGNTEAMLKEARNKRLKESREKRKATKDRRLQEKKQRAIEWIEHKNQAIDYLGKDVSQDLSKHEENTDKLKAAGLPSFADAKQLAISMNMTVNELRFLAYTRAASKQSHYKRFEIPKKTGGVRHISAPMPRLKQAQKWMQHNILEKVELNQAANGFRLGRSIITNAEPHVKQDVVINMDLKDFFPTISYRRVKGMFRSLGYSPAIASIFSLLCTEHKIVETEIDGETYFLATEERVLPQGAPSSPAITNIICRGLDARLSGLAQTFGYKYSRYADDITFSCSGEAKEHVGKIMRRSAYIISDEGFHIHPDKTRILRKGQRQEVTGIVVNDGLSISRKTLRNFKSVLFQIEKDGPAGKKWGQSPHVLSAIRGYANFVCMVHPEKGAAFMQRVEAIWAKYGRGESAPISRERWSGKQAEALVAEQVVQDLVEIDKEAKKSETDISEPAPAAPSVQGNERPPLREHRQAPSKKKPWWKFW